MAITFCSPSAFARKHKKHKNPEIAANPLAGVNSKQPDKELFDKAMKAMKHGRYDVARLDLQTLLNTYPDSEYQMRAKLAVGDTWFKEGGSAALTQAESEYKDFITFFPNSPEAAEAQMKVGDIYFQQMEKPDRDPQNAVHAEQEYRTMLEQFPDSPLIPRAKQRLREVQEVLAQRQYEIGEFYAGREQWPAAIARLETVTDTYPLFSHSDQALITIGDGYATMAQMTGKLRIPERSKAELMRYYDDRAAAAWDRVVTRYPLAPHVEDAKDRLIALGRNVPDPTPQALAESQAEEESRVNVHFGVRSLQIFGRSPNTVRAARVGDPSLDSPPPVLAPEVVHQGAEAYNAALRGQPIPSSSTSMAGSSTGGGAASTATVQNGAGPAPGQGAALTFEEVPDATGTPGSTVTVEVPSAPAAAAPAEGAAAAAPEHSNAEPLVKPVGPENNKPLPSIDKPSETPEQVNQVPAGGNNAQVQTGTTAAGKPSKKKKAPYNKKDESSSKHKKKTGIDKLNPF